MRKHILRQGQALTRVVPGQGTEYFAYSARGLTNYTGPDSKVTRCGYDEAARKTSETTAKNENIGYTYNAGGDLLTLTDGRSKVTTWTYDIEGLVRTKKYSGQTFANIEYSYALNQRLAWRKFWSDAVTSKQTIYNFSSIQAFSGRQKSHIGNHIVCKDALGTPTANRVTRRRARWPGKPLSALGE